MDGANVEERKFQFLYKEGSESFVFMDEQTYDQVSVPARIVDEEWRFLKENLVVDLTFL